MPRLLTILAFLSVGAGLALAAPAEAKDAAASPTPPAASATTAPPAKLRQLLDLMEDPQIKAWLAQQKAAAGASGNSDAANAPQSHGRDDELRDLMTHVTTVQAHLATLKAAIPLVGSDLALAREAVMRGFEKEDIAHMLRLFALFVGLGFGLEWLFRRATLRSRDRFDHIALDTVKQRLTAVGIRLAFAVGVVTSFAAGSVGAFLALGWSRPLKEIVLGYLVAFLVVRLSVVIGRFLLAPRARRYRDISRFRIIPMSDEAAGFWQRRLVAVVAISAFGWVVLDELLMFGVSDETSELLGYALGLVLLGVAVEAVWRAPRAQPAQGIEEAEQRHHREAQTAGLSLYLFLLWALWVSGAMTLFWIAALALAVPAAIRLTERGVAHILRPPGHESASLERASVSAVCLERGLRSLIVVGALVWLAHIWSVDLGDMMSRSTVAVRIVRGVLIATVVVLIADFVWNLAKAVIDLHVADAGVPGQLMTEEDGKRARLRTLLPILRNMLFVVIVVIAAMMGLSALGVQIGPLIASAGVVGVAIGFGAQTLVRDVISGIFYLLDDAFRVGEYIQSGNYRGVVESFSLRSVKLRHQNGPLFTVPFGVLGAVQNMSRDWAIEKLTVGVTYDTDLEKARKIIKKVGQELAADPELAEGIMQPLKMQGVQAFGDFAIQLRMKMMTRPGDVQFLARRRALALIKKAFDANGIAFAFPTVQLAGGGAAAPGVDASNVAVAQMGLGLVKPAASG